MKASLSILVLAIAVTVLMTSCIKEFSYENTIRGSLKDSLGFCLPSGIHGDFVKGVDVNFDSNYSELLVNVVTTGPYAIATNTSNGFRFSGSGSFDNTGLQTVKLHAEGTPKDSGYTSFTICLDSSCCDFGVLVAENKSPELPPNAWLYTDISSGKTYSGNFTATQYIVTPISTLVSLRKQANSSADTSFEISFVFPRTGIVTGSFLTDKGNAWSYSHEGVCVNCAWEVAFNLYNVLTTILVTDYDAATQTITGRFSGTTINGNNEIAPIKDGRFKAVVEH